MEDVRSARVAGIANAAERAIAPGASEKHECTSIASIDECRKFAKKRVLLVRPATVLKSLIKRTQGKSVDVS